MLAAPAVISCLPQPGARMSHDRAGAAGNQRRLNAFQRTTSLTTTENALFASGDDGGERWACIASLVETCKLNGVDPQRYFTDVLTRLVNGWMENRLDELMPWHWAASKNS